MGIIEPRTPKGFKDALPEEARLRAALMAKLALVYESFGFVPIETPTIERPETLLSGDAQGMQKQIYRVIDTTGEVVGAVRYDLTVPLARFVAQHLESGRIAVPFKRYHMGKVMRGENPQHGRFREFYQCDFDVIGAPSEASDIETAQVFIAAFEAVGVKRFTVQVNDRNLLEGVVRAAGWQGEVAPILRALDKLRKAGIEKTKEELVAAGLSPAYAEELLGVLVAGGNPSEPLRRRIAGQPGALAALKRLERMRDIFLRLGQPETRLRIAPDLARGLAYYTGVVFEVFLDDVPALGAVGAGGRYDNLVADFSTRDLKGVGGCVGIDRLITGLKDLGVIAGEKRRREVMVAMADDGSETLIGAVAAGAQLRAAGITTKVFPGPARLGTQLAFADKDGVSIVVIVGGSQAAGRLVLKDLRRSVQEVVDTRDLLAAAQRFLRADVVPAAA